MIAKTIIGTMFILLILLSSVHGYDPKTKNPDGIVPVQKPDLPKLNFSWMLFDKVECEKVNSNNWATLSIQLKKPCLPARIYYGFANQGLPLMPVYNQSVVAQLINTKEKTGAQQQATLNLTKLFSDLNWKSFTTYYRVEVYDSEKQYSTFYDGRFTCHRTASAIKIVTINSGPFVDCTTGNSAIISFETNCPTVGWVIIDDDNGNTSQFKSCGAKRHHEITIGGLKAATRYHYRVKAQGEGVETISRRFYFKTAPIQPGKFSFAAMTDSRGGMGGGALNYMGTNLAMMRTLLADIYRRNVDVVFFPGDMVNGYTNLDQDFLQQLHAWRYATEAIGAFIPIYEGIGNHEMCMDSYNDGSRYGFGINKTGKSSTESLFAEVFVNPTNGPEPGAKHLPPYKENVFYVDYAQVRFVMLNTNYWICKYPEQYGGNLEGYILKEQFQWLEKVLDDAEKSTAIHHVFIGTHEPVFPVSKHAKDAMWYHGGKAKKGYDREYILKSRDRFWQSVVDHPKVVAVITGDEHNYARLKIDSKTPVYLDGTGNPSFSRPIWFFITGGAGAPLYPAATSQVKVPWENSIVKFLAVHHYLLFDVSPQEIVVKCVAKNGAIVDECVIWQAKK